VLDEIPAARVKRDLDFGISLKLHRPPNRHDRGQITTTEPGSCAECSPLCGAKARDEEALHVLRDGLDELFGALKLLSPDEHSA